MIGFHIRRLRQLNNSSVETIAHNAGITPSVLESVECGEIFPVDVPVLMRIVDALNIRNGSDFESLVRWNRPPKFKVFATGIGRTGTLSMARIFDNYRSCHQFMIEDVLEVLRLQERGEANETDICNLITKRETLSRLEVDSSGHHFAYIEHLVSLFPEAKFIHVIRDCYSWCESVLNNIQRPRGEFDSPGTPVFRELKTISADKGDFYRDLPGFLDDILGYWGRANHRVLEFIPRTRSIIIPTSEISSSLPLFSDFLGLPAASLISENSHLHRIRRKRRILRALDPDLVEQTVKIHCSDLMDRYFPGYTFRDYLESRAPEAGSRPGY